MLSPVLTVSVFLLVLSLHREKSNNCIKPFISASFCTVFCKLLSSQASSSLIFGINLFSVCIILCACVFFVLFFKINVFTGLLFYCLYIFI